MWEGHFFCEIRAGARISRGSEYSVTPGALCGCHWYVVIGGYGIDVGILV